MDLYFDSSTDLEEHVNKGYKLVAVSCPLASFTTRSNGSFLLIMLPTSLVTLMVRSHATQHPLPNHLLHLCFIH